MTIEIDGYTIKLPEQATAINALGDHPALYLDDTPKLRVLYPDGVNVPVGIPDGAMSLDIPEAVVSGSPSSLVLSGWSQDSKHMTLCFELELGQDSGVYQTLRVRPNSDSVVANYNFSGWHSLVSTPAGLFKDGRSVDGLFGHIAGFFAHSGANINTKNIIRVEIDNYNVASEKKTFRTWVDGYFGDGTPFQVMSGGHYIETTSAITSLQILFTAGNIENGSRYKAWVE